MAAYLLAHKDTKELETIVFAGEGGDVVAVFSDPKNAQQYIDDAEWQADYTVATLEPIDFTEWLIKCHRNGVKFMATDPTRAEQTSGQRLNTLNIEAHLNHAGQHITSVANPDF